MRKTRNNKSAFKITTIIVLCCLSSYLHAQYGTKSGDWPSYGGDTGSTKYSPLNQITVENFEQLEVAWTWTSIDADLDLEAIQEINDAVRINNFQGTPLKVGNKLFIITALNQIAAINPTSGETIWSFNPS